MHQRFWMQRIGVGTEIRRANAVLATTTSARELVRRCWMRQLPRSPRLLSGRARARASTQSPMPNQRNSQIALRKSGQPAALAAPRATVSNESPLERRRRPGDGTPLRRRRLREPPSSLPLSPEGDGVMAGWPRRGSSIASAASCDRSGRTQSAVLSAAVITPTRTPAFAARDAPERGSAAGRRRPRACRCAAARQARIARRRRRPATQAG